MVHLDRFRSLK